MTEIPLYDPSEDVPLPKAREDMRFTNVALQPYPDGRRVKLQFALTPFVERPSVEVRVTNPLGDEVASLSLIEAMDTEFDFTIHLRGPEPNGEHTVHLTMFYPVSDDGPIEERQVVAEETATFAARSP
jgi:hypothetical protein